VTDWSHLQEEFLDQHNDQLKLDRRHHTGAELLFLVIAIV
jgi:hypothetical protein